MKYIVLFAMLLLVIPVQSQDKAAGDVSALATFQGFSNLGVTDFNGGFGLRYYLSNTLSVRGTFGAVLNTGSDNTQNFNTSGALLFAVAHTKNTSAYIGPQIFYTHKDPSENIYKIGGVVGFGFSPWEDVGLYFEYGVDVTKIGDLTTTTFGKTTGLIGLEVGL